MERKTINEYQLHPKVRLVFVSILMLLVVLLLLNEGIAFNYASIVLGVESSI